MAEPIISDLAQRTRFSILNKCQLKSAANNILIEISANMAHIGPVKKRCDPETFFQQIRRPPLLILKHDRYQ
jgi:hypothetical protein